jgi:hypothetical protein
VNALVRHTPLGISDLAGGLCWHAGDLVMAVWMKYDESGEYDAQGNLLNMTLGGCVTTLEKWQALDLEWKQILDSELSHVPEDQRCFHMTDFEAWVPPFDFKLPNGERDKEKHNRILNRLLDAMLRHIEGFHGFGAVSQFDPSVNFGPMTHHKLMNDCINGAVKYAVLDIWDFYREPLSLCFAKQEHIPAELIGRYLNVYDYGPAEGRIKSHCFGRPIDIYGLQAADLFAYEMGRAQRTGRPERYPFNRLVEGAKANGLRMTIYWGPIRSSILTLSEARKPLKGPPS